MSELLFLLFGLVAGAVGLFVWARYNKQKAIDLLNLDFEAKAKELQDQLEGEFTERVDEAKRYIDDELLGDLDEKVAAKIKELLDSLKNK